MSVTASRVVDTSDLFDSVFGTANALPDPVVAPEPTTPEPVIEPTPAVQPPPPGERVMSESEILDTVFGTLPVEVPPVETPKPVETPEGLKPAPAPADVPVEEPKGEEADLQNSVLKSTIEHYVQSGRWQPIEGFEDLEVTPDVFSQIADMQDEYRINQKWGDVKQSSELVGGLIDYLDAGGDPDKFIDLVKEQRSLQEIDTTSQDGKLETIRRYYQDMQSWDKKAVDRKIKKLESDGDEEIEAEFEIANTKYSEHFTKERDRLVKEAADKTQAEQVQKQTRAKNTYGELQKLGIKDDAAKKYVTDMFQPKYSLPDGTLISEYDKRLLDIQNDPARFADLLQFVLDDKAFLARKTVAATNQKVDKAFNPLKWAPNKPSNSPKPNLANPAPKTETDNFYLSVAGIKK